MAEVQVLIDEFRSVARNGSTAEALASFYAYESQIPRIAKEKATGLTERYGADNPTAGYFKLHQTADVQHSRVWRDLLPDIYLNPHGYPSHEWVQPFAGYVPPGFRTYLSTRGWYTTIGTLRDPRYPDHADATAALREAIVREINANPDVRAMDLRHQARYRKWAYGFGPYVFNQEVYKDTAIYYSDPETGEPSGSRRFGAGRGGNPGGEGGGAGGGTGRFSMNAWPQVTFFSGGTEATEETEQGEWLNLTAKAGLSYLMASVKYLRDGQYTVHRIEEDAARDSVSLTTVRIRPVMPARTSPQRQTSTGGQ